MPEPITFTQQDTPALSPENVEMLQAGEQGEESTGLLAGKYKTVDELEKAYREAQRKLSQPRDLETENDSQSEEEEYDDQSTEEAPAYSAREVYGDLIGGRLEEAGVDFQSMSDRWSQTGQLDDGDYGELEQAGFTREMVDAYLAGLNFQVARDSQMTAQEISSIKQEYGGEAQYADMIQWASTNLPKEEIDTFNQVVNGQPMNVVKLAIAGLYAKYTQATGGREPRLVGGRSPKSSGEKFESTAQLVEAMGDPRYKSDPAYRRKVEEKLARSSVM